MSFSRKATKFLKSEGLDNPCKFTSVEKIESLRVRSTAYWHALYKGRHIGLHRPDASICNWTARILTKDGLYRQKCLGSALELGNSSIDYRTALARAFEWFETSEVKAMTNTPRAVGRTKDISICPIGDVYTVGHALKEYSEWTRIARSEGGHYNNLVLINYHLIRKRPVNQQLPVQSFDQFHGMSSSILLILWSAT
jgi:hypothetical protein